MYRGRREESFFRECEVAWLWTEIRNKKWMYYAEKKKKKKKTKKNIVTLFQSKIKIENLRFRKPSREPNNCMFWAMTEAEGEVGYP